MRHCAARDGQVFLSFSGVSEHKQIGVISLGVLGQRMLARLAEHPRARALVAWDPNPAVVAEVRKCYPALRIAATAAEVIATPTLNCVYIASPPASHLGYAHQGFERIGKVYPPMAAQRRMNCPFCDVPALV